MSGSGPRGPAQWLVEYHSVLPVIRTLLLWLMQQSASVDVEAGMQLEEAVSAAKPCSQSLLRAAHASRAAPVGPAARQRRI